jgi:hypothetical protein
MECGDSVNRQVLILALVLGLLAAPAQSRADHLMVLIANQGSPLNSVRPLDVRKIYLGYHVTNDDGRPIRATTNVSSRRLWEIFVQDVMGMTERSYDRRLLTLTLQSGRRRPDEYEDLEQLLDRIETDNDAVAFVWEDDIRDRADIKIVRVLWRN